MASIDFIFTQGIWLGEGKISFSTSPESIKYYTKWQCEEHSGVFRARQIVEMQGVEESTVNHFTFILLSPDAFTVLLENNQIGTIPGTGKRQGPLITWEFRDPPLLEGFESYEKQENGEYVLHAEYGSMNSFGTTIEGKIWHKDL